MTIENNDAVSRPVDESTTAEEAGSTSTIAELTEKIEAADASSVEGELLQSDSAGTQNDDAVSRPVDEPSKTEEVPLTSSTPELTESAEAPDASDEKVVLSNDDSVENNEPTDDGVVAPPPVSPVTQGEVGVG